MWTVEHLRGDAGDIHARIPPDDIGPTVWVITATAPALVLGSTQTDADVDTDACRAAGVTVARRRSGGGAVLVVPGEMCWIDVIVPADHTDWTDDVVHAGWWMGDTWASALTDLGITGTTVHHGGLVSTPWSRLVCFAGTGPGEVMIGERKLVGISQRRTRSHARFQCAIHHVWRPDTVRELLRFDDALGAEFDAVLHDATAISTIDDDALVDALATRLDQPASGR